MADKNDKKPQSQPKAKRPKDVASYKPKSFQRGSSGPANEVNPHAADEMPSMIRKANEVFQQHQFQEKKRKNEPNSYRPNYSSSTKDRQPTPNDNHNFDDLIGEIMRQQVNVREKKKGIFTVKTDNATKLRVLVLIVILVTIAKFRSQQDSNQDTFERLKEAQKEVATGQRGVVKSQRAAMFEKIDKVEISKAFNQNENHNNQTEKSQPNVALAAHAPPVPVLTEQQRADRKLAAWGDLLTCASQSVWSGYHSPGFVKLADDLMLYSAGDAIYSFTPYFAGGQMVFNGWFWERSFGKLASLAGQDMRKYFPTADFVFPYVHLYGRGARYQMPGAFYVKIRRGGGIIGNPFFRMGQPVTKVQSGDLKQIDEYPVMWVRDIKYLREEFATILLQEVELQVQRFKANEANPWPLVSYSRGLNTPWNVHEDQVLGACQKAGEQFNSTAIYNAAVDQRKRLREDQNALWFPSLQVTTLNLDGRPGVEPFWYPSRYTSNEFRACLLKERIPSGQQFWVTMGLSSGGIIKSLSINAKEEHLAEIESCFRPLVRKMYYPGGENDDRRISLLYRFQ